jgi:hypothetical protein
MHIYMNLYEHIYINEWIGASERMELLVLLHIRPSHAHHWLPGTDDDHDDDCNEGFL